MRVLFLLLFSAYVVQAVVVNGLKSEEPKPRFTRAALGPSMPFLLLLFYLVFEAGLPGRVIRFLSGVGLIPQNHAGALLGVAGVAIAAVITGVSLWRARQAGSQGDRSRAVLTSVLSGLQTVVLFLACYAAYERGVFTRALVSPLYIGLGLLGGAAVFGVSLLVTSRSWGAFFEHFGELRLGGHFLAENPPALFGSIDVGMAEEMIYRAAAQPMLIEATGRSWASIVAVAAAFSVVHWHFFRNTRAQSIEFFGFALLLGALYHWTGSIILVIVIHVLRNLEIVYLEYLLKRDELGDDALALQAMEDAYTRATLEQS